MNWQSNDYLEEDNAKHAEQYSEKKTRQENQEYATDAAENYTKEKMTSQKQSKKDLQHITMKQNHYWNIINRGILFIQWTRAEK